MQKLFREIGFACARFAARILPVLGTQYRDSEAADS